MSKEKIQSYAEGLKQNLDIKKSRVDETLFKYQNLIDSSDQELRFERVTQGNPVYNSPHASKGLKESISKRKLVDMTKDEFMNQYKAILHGINPEDSQLEREAQLTVKKPYSTLSLETVPTEIDQRTSLIAGHTKDYLKRICAENQLTGLELADILEMKKKYETNLPTLMGLVNEDYSLERIDDLLDLREALTIREHKEGRTKTVQRPSLKTLKDFYKVFGREGVDFSDLAGTIEEIHSIVSSPHIDSSIKTVLDKAKEGRIFTLEAILDDIQGISGFDEKIRRPVPRKKESETIELTGVFGEDYREESFP